jgi:hypothetical protein
MAKGAYRKSYMLSHFEAILHEGTSVPTKRLTCGREKTWSSEQKSFDLFKRSPLGDGSPVSAW